MEESYLCQRCRSVDWDAAFAPIPYWKQWETQTVLEFRSTLEVRPDSHCRLCLAIASLFELEDVEPTDEFDQRFLLVAVASSTITDDMLNDLDGRDRLRWYNRYKKSPTWLIGIDEYEEYKLGHPGWNFTSSRRRFLVENRALEPDESGLEIRTPSRTVDFDRLRRWLSHCRYSEPYARPLDLPGMRVIDCELREIVPLPAAHPEYATLSYVWGQSEAPCSTDGKLSDRLPLTIEDSITVCQELGVRYLWVDRYCIQESHKHALIRSMHRIYHESQFTIIAAAGCGPDYGLPGVGNTPRLGVTAVDRSINVGLRQLSYINDVRFNLQRSFQRTANSRWAKRGWTLQEGLLSKRICIFLDDQVHFENEVEAQSERIRPCKPTQLGPKLTYMGPSDYWQTVSAYCSRDLSYPEDAFNAISGIFSTWTQNTRTFRHIGGLAVQLKYNGKQLVGNALLKSLLWRVLRPVPRRRGFPSWAWTGWLNPKVQHMDDKMTRSLFVLDSVETDDRDIIDHTQLLDLLRVQHELLDSIKILHITAEVIDICIGPSDSMPSIDQHVLGNQIPRSEWQAMIVSNGRETVYECETTKLVTKDDICPSTSCQYIQCKGLRLGSSLNPTFGYPSEEKVMVVLWDEDGGYYERFGFLCIRGNHLPKTKFEKIKLG